MPATDITDERVCESARESPIAYADRRRKETGRPYIVTSGGHVWLDVPGNRALLKTMDLTIAYRS